MDKITDCEYKASSLFLTSLACDFVYFRTIRGYRHTSSLSSLKAALCQTDTDFGYSKGKYTRGRKRWRNLKDYG